MHICLLVLWLETLEARIALYLGDSYYGLGADFVVTLSGTLQRAFFAPFSTCLPSNPQYRKKSTLT